MGGAVERVDECGMHARFPHVCLGCLHQIKQVDQCAAGNFDHMFHDDEYGTLNSGKQSAYINHTMLNVGRVWRDSGNVTTEPPVVVICNETYK